VPAWPLVAAVALAATTWHISSLVATSGIDPSWQVGLHLAVARRLGFGSGFTWTYGPLGFLGFPLAVTGWTLVLSFLFVAVASIALAWLLVRRAAPVVGPPAAVLLAYFALGLPVQAADLLLLIELVLAVLALDQLLGVRAFALAGGFAAGLAALTKTNTGAAAVVIAVAVCLVLGREALAGIGVLLATFLAGWLASGSSLTGIPEWLRLSASVVSGYGAAMQYDQPGLHAEYVYAGVVIAFTMAAAVLHARRLGRARGAVLVLAAAVFAFTFFKEGFVRHDAVHSSSFFAAAAIGCLVLAARDASRWVALAGVLVAVFAVHRSGELHYAPLASARRAGAQVADVVVTHRRSGLVAESRSSERRSYQVPASLLALLRGHTVHVDPVETAAVNAYGLAWRPLPVLQAYNTYTSVLDEHNAAYLASRRAPQRVLRGDLADLVNGRPHELEAPAEFRALICNYVQSGASGAWQVLAHRANRCGRTRKLGTVTTASDVPVTVPEARPDELVIARVWTPNPLGNQLRGLAYKPNVPGISFDGEQFVPFDSDVGPDGIVLHVPASAGFGPAFGGAIDWRTIAVGSLGGPVRIEFDAIPVAGRVPPPAGERSRAPLPRYALVTGGLRTPAGRTLPIGTGGGFVDYTLEQRDDLVLHGWAGDGGAGEPASSILVFAGGKLVFAGAPNVARPDVAAALGKPGLTRSGYTIVVPQLLVRVRNARAHVRVIAIVGGRALELTYMPDYAWR